MKNLILFFSLLFSIALFMPTETIAQAHDIKINADQDKDSLYVMLTDTVFSKYRHGKGKWYNTLDAFAIETFDGCKTWTGVIAQATTAAPTATVIRNTLGDTVAWTRDSLGVYKAELDDTFTSNKSWVSGTIGNATGLVIQTYIQSDSTFIVKILDDTGAAVDLGGNAYIKCEVHP